jgi:hypothetical protein
MSPLNRHRLVLVSPRRFGNVVEHHLAEGGAVATMQWEDEQDHMVLIRDGETILSLPADGLDNARSGEAIGRSAEMRLFALALAHGLGLSASKIGEAIRRAPKIVSTANRENRRRAAAESGNQA